MSTMDLYDIPYDSNSQVQGDKTTVKFSKSNDDKTTPSLCKNILFRF